MNISHKTTVQNKSHITVPNYKFCFYSGVPLLSSVCVPHESSAAESAGCVLLLFGPLQLGQIP